MEGKGLGDLRDASLLCRASNKLGSEAAGLDTNQTKLIQIEWLISSNQFRDASLSLMKDKPNQRTDCLSYKLAGQWGFLVVYNSMSCIQPVSIHHLLQDLC